MNQAPIEVHVDRSASASELKAVEQAFREANMDAEVRADYEAYSALPPWAIYVAVPTAAIFWAGFVGAAGADAWKGLRDLVGKLFRARGQSKNPKGSVVLTITDVHEKVVFSDGLPDEAYRSLLKIEITQTQCGQIQWDDKAGAWRDPWDADRAT
jgi:hypothetical protein